MTTFVVLKYWTILFAAVFLYTSHSVWTHSQMMHPTPISPVPSEKLLGPGHGPSVWPLRERLALATALLDVDNRQASWQAIAKKLSRFTTFGRPDDWCSARACAKQYALLLDSAELTRRQKIPSDVQASRKHILNATQTAPVSSGLSVTERLVKRLTAERVEELRERIRLGQKYYNFLKTKLTELGAGTYDEHLDALCSSVGLPPQIQTDGPILNSSSLLNNSFELAEHAKNNCQPTSSFSSLTPEKVSKQIEEFASVWSEMATVYSVPESTWICHTGPGAGKSMKSIRDSLTGSGRLNTLLTEASATFRPSGGSKTPFTLLGRRNLLKKNNTDNVHATTMTTRIAVATRQRYLANSARNRFGQAASSKRQRGRSRKWRTVGSEPETQSAKRVKTVSTIQTLSPSNTNSSTGICESPSHQVKAHSGASTPSTAAMYSSDTEELLETDDCVESAPALVATSPNDAAPTDETSGVDDDEPATPAMCDSSNSSASPTTSQTTEAASHLEDGDQVGMSTDVTLEQPVTAEALGPQSLQYAATTAPDLLSEVLLNDPVPLEPTDHCSEDQREIDIENVITGVSTSSAQSKSRSPSPSYDRCVEAIHDITDSVAVDRERHILSSSDTVVSEVSLTSQDSRRKLELHSTSNAREPSPSKSSREVTSLSNSVNDTKTNDQMSGECSLHPPVLKVPDNSDVGMSVFPDDTNPEQPALTDSLCCIKNAIIQPVIDRGAYHESSSPSVIRGTPNMGRQDSIYNVCQPHELTCSSSSTVQLMGTNLPDGCLPRALGRTPERLISEDADQPVEVPDTLPQRKNDMLVSPRGGKLTSLCTSSPDTFAAAKRDPPLSVDGKVGSASSPLIRASPAVCLSFINESDLECSKTSRRSSLQGQPEREVAVELSPCLEADYLYSSLALEKTENNAIGVDGKEDSHPTVSPEEFHTRGRSHQKRKSHGCKRKTTRVASSLELVDSPFVSLSTLGPEELERLAFQNGPTATVDLEPITAVFPAFQSEMIPGEHCCSPPSLDEVVNDEVNARSTEKKESLRLRFSRKGSDMVVHAADDRQTRDTPTYSSPHSSACCGHASADSDLDWLSWSALCLSDAENALSTFVTESSFLKRSVSNLPRPESQARQTVQALLNSIRQQIRDGEISTRPQFVHQMLAALSSLCMTHSSNTVTFQLVMHVYRQIGTRLTTSLYTGHRDSLY
ncbi:hypothetical protein P879_05263 [Paragonimus westermani]|uniref:Uncharacterized protein n=1 Tax=Paragonimus westermani TaxID=34504 RepID=A0A8T0DI34_9TREM|nr:hypothetical protein P879_05263 [Paragonimus westermani]